MCDFLWEEKTSFNEIDQSPMSKKWFDYADAKYLFDLHKARSQMSYLLTYGGTTISWYSTNSCYHFFKSCRNLHEASRACVCLRSMIHHIAEICDFSLRKNISNISITMYEDNQLQMNVSTR